MPRQETELQPDLGHRWLPDWILRPLARMEVGRVLAVMVLLLPVVAIYARQQIVAVLIFGALAAVAAARIGKPAPPSRWAGLDPWPFVAFALFAGWAAFSLIWTIDPARSIGVSGKLAGIGLAGFLIVLAARRCREQDRAIVGIACIAAAGLSIFSIGVEGLIDLAVIKWLWPLLGQVPPKKLVYLNFPLLVMSAIVPLASIYALVRGWGWIALLLYAAALAVALQLESASAILSLLVSGLGLLVFGWTPRWFGHAAAAFALAMAMLFIPVMGKPLAGFRPALQTAERMGDSARHRLAIWGALSGKLRENPVTGVGMGAVRSIPRKNEFIAVPNSDGSPARLRVYLIPMHPHNAGLEIGLELGAIGIALALFLVLALLRTALAATDDRWACAGIAALACAIAATSMTALSIWNYAYLSTWLVIFALLVAWRPRRDPDQSS